MKEKLQQRLQQLIKERETAIGTVLNYNGAISAVQQLLQEELQQAAPEAPQKPAKKTKVINITPESVS